MENTSFDFKKMIKQRISDDIKPVLKREGFVLLTSCTFIREKDGLLQILYFKVQKTRLKPWAYFMPIYLPCIHVADYGTDGGFAELVSGIRNAVLPEMERISSLSRFVRCLETDRFMWGKTLGPCPNDRNVIDIACQTGVRRVKTLQAAAKELDGLIPKSLLAVITGINAEDMDNQEADVWFEDYCNRVRDKFKLR